MSQIREKKPWEGARYCPGNRNAKNPWYRVFDMREQPVSSEQPSVEVDIWYPFVDSRFEEKQDN